MASDLWRRGAFAAGAMHMRYRYCLGLLLLAGCVSTPTVPDENATAQVGSTPFHEPGKLAPTKVNYAPAAPDIGFRVVQVNGKLIGDNPQIGLKPFAIAIGSTDPEIFHVGLNYIYITEGLVRQCQSDAVLAAVLANEMGRMIAEREKSVADQIRAPEPMPPPSLPIGGIGNSREADPTRYVEMAFFEKQHPKTPPKLTPVNPQVVARSILEKAGFQRTDLDAALPILQNADRNSVLTNQFKGPAKQSDWKAP
jgi:hypothetical protein